MGPRAGVHRGRIHFGVSVTVYTIEQEIKAIVQNWRSTEITSVVRWMVGFEPSLALYTRDPRKLHVECSSSVRSRNAVPVRDISDNPSHRQGLQR
jgi:hypothetical protein